jgi:quercetin dioxygenase-like cupin family protein
VLSVFVDDQWRTLTAGESLSIPPNTVHTLRNRSSAEVRFRDVHGPALDFQEYIEELDAEAAAGRITSRMTPRR